MSDIDDVATWVAFVALFALCAAGFGYQIAPASVFPVVTTDLGIGSVAAGWIVSACILAQATTNVPIGMSLSRVDDRRLIGVGAVGLAAAGVWSWVAASRGDYYSLLASRFLGGAAAMAVWTAGLNLLPRFVPERHRSTAAGVFAAGSPTGIALGQVVGPPVTAVAGWPAALLLFGVATLPVYAVFRLACTRVSFAPPAGETPDRRALRRVLTDRRVWAVAAMAFGTYSLILFFNSWMPSYFADRFDLSLAASGVLAALFPALGAVSRSSGGYLAERLFGQRAVETLAFLVTVPVVALFPFVGAPLQAVALLVVGGFFVQLGVGIYFTHARRLSADSVSATAIALVGSVATTGAFLSPVVAGFLLERTGSYRAPFLCVTVVAVAGLALARVAPEP